MTRGLEVCSRVKSRFSRNDEVREVGSRDL